MHPSVCNPEPDFFRQPWNFRGLELPNRVVLAPLAGVSDAPFRRICQEHGAGLTYVEMLSSIAVVRESRQTMEMLLRRDDTWVNRHTHPRRWGAQARWLTWTSRAATVHLRSLTTPPPTAALRST